MHLVAYLPWLIRRLTNDTSAAVGAEHALLVVFVAIIAVFGMVILGPSIAEYFVEVGDAVPDPATVPSCQMDPFSACPPP